MAEPPCDEICQKLHALMRIGYNRQVLIESVLLLREIHWATTAAEQGHGSIAVIHKYHNKYGPDMLRQRGFIHMVRPLFTAPRTAVHRERLQASLERLRKRRPESITGRHIYCGEAMALAKQQQGHAMLSQEATHIIMRGRGDKFNALPLPLRLQYADRAQQQVAAVRKDIDGRIALTIVDIRRHDDRERLAERSCGWKHILDNCRLSVEGICNLRAMLNSSQYIVSEVEWRRSVAMVAPEVPTYKAQRALLEYEAPAGAPERKCPDWCKPICKRR